MTTHKTACILCSRNCGIEIEVEDRRFVKIRGDEAHPASKGYICQKAARLDFYQNNEDRLTHPLRRTSDGTFERVSWDTALSEIAQRLIAIRTQHGGPAFAFYGGGGQGNHLGAAYGPALIKTMGSPYLYSALAQEKTGDFWVNGKLFGRQTCHITEDVVHADFVLFIGTNPWQAHGIPNARDTVRDLGRDRARKMAVIDPRRTETAALADVHLQLKPGTDAFLLSAMLAIMLRDDSIDRDFIAARTVGFESVQSTLLRVPVRQFVERAGVELKDVEWVAHQLAKAARACVRIDLGLQQSLHSTLNSYLEKLVFLLTGNFGIEGGNNFHSLFLPLVGHSDENSPKTRATGIAGIGKLYPPNVLPMEIDNDRDDRVRALWIDSANPMMSGADTQAYERAFAKLELLVVVDVALTESARTAHYVLPAASQFEKWEATFFNLEFPQQTFHVRAPILEPVGEARAEADIYCELLVKMGELPKSHPWLERLAKIDHRLYTAALGATLLASPRLRKYGAHVVYRTLGRRFSTGGATAPLWVLAHGYARKYPDAVRAAGHKGRGFSLGESLFRSIFESRSGTLLSRHRYEDTWGFLRHPDRKIHLDIPEMLRAIDALQEEAEPDALLPFVLIAGERRAYNANTIYRDPAWRKNDRDGAMRMHPEDAAGLGLKDGDRAICRSARGEIEVTIELYDAVRPGVVTLPHGYGMRYRGESHGPALNQLTDSSRRDPIAGTPYHKYVPVAITPSDRH